MKTDLKRLLKSVTILAGTSYLFACGGTGQDDGQTSEFNQNYSGLVVDGYVARATVFLDTNNDSARNAWEPYAFTDDQGYFSYNPLTDKDYCATTATPDEAQYCLRSSIEYENVVLRIDGGYDILTGEPFTGQLSRRLNDGDLEKTALVVSPLTTLLSSASDQAQKDTILSALEINESDLDVDYLNSDGNGDINEALLNTALKVHKIVTILGDKLTDTYTEIGDEVGTPNDATSEVYRQLASALASSGENLSTTLSSNSTLVEILDNSEQSLRNIYEENSFNLPADLGDSGAAENFARVIEVSQGISDVVDSIINTNTEIANSDAASGIARALESVVVKALNETSTDSSIDNAIEFFTNEENSALVSSLIQNLQEDDSDLISLVNNDFAGEDFDSEEEISNAITLPDSAEPFSLIAGMQVRVSDLDLGSPPNNLKDSEIEVYFSGDTTAISGSFMACVKYIDGASTDGSLGDGNTRGELVDGFWSLLGANDSNNNQSYSLLLTITLLGTTYQAIMKPNGTATISGVDYDVIRFDNDGEVGNWYSLNGLTETGTIPDSNEECAERLPSRVGI